MKFVLAGQPNSGKSTIFNGVAGYRSATANFPGSSVSFTSSRALVHGREIEIVDLPGIYSLTSTDAEEGVALHYLLEEDFDLIIDVVDASRLGRSLEMTLQLIDLGRPMIVALNMIDEAKHKGIQIDLEALSEKLGVPVVATIGSRGIGLKALFRAALLTAHQAEPPEYLKYDREVEAAISSVQNLLDGACSDRAPCRFLASKLLERDPYVENRIFEKAPDIKPRVMAVVGDLQNVHGWTADQVVSGSRHAVAHNLEDVVSKLTRPDYGWRERLDRVLLHPVSGGPIMVGLLAFFFFVVFRVGVHIEGPLLVVFDGMAAKLATLLPPETFMGSLVGGLVLGFSGGVAIVLPYLVPFLVGLAIFEDTGYLPRMAYILDNFMHRIGLHGKSVLPLVLGYGCSVPAIMATRILESPQDRRLTSALTAFIPCSARTVVIYGLVAAYLGPLWAVSIYLLNIVVIVIIGNVLARSMKGRSPGLILEIPDLRLPTLRTLAAKTWLSLKEFIIIAWPLIMVSSAVLGILEYLQAATLLNTMLVPLTVWLLGLPALVGVTLVFGVLRKELTLVMLVQALGTADVASVMTTNQLVVFTLFVVFYIPCIATVGAMAHELGWKDTAWVSGLTVVVAIVISFAARLILLACGIA